MEGKAKDIAGVVAPPPLLYGGALIAGLALHRVWPAQLFAADLPATARLIPAVALILGGIAVLAIGIRQFRRAGTNVPTRQPTTALVTDGVYRRSRNPLYVALSLIYGGIALLADSLWVLALLAPLLVVMHYGVIAREERYLEAKFGDEYRRYKAAVRRWL